MLGAGRYNEELTFKRLETVPNGSGGQTSDFVPFLTTRAKIAQKSVSNDLIAQQPELTGVFEAKIRRRNIEIKKSDSVEWNGRPCEITGFPEPMNKTEITLLLRMTNDEV